MATEHLAPQQSALQTEEAEGLTWAEGAEEPKALGPEGFEELLAQWASGAEGAEGAEEAEAADWLDLREVREVGFLYL